MVIVAEARSQLAEAARRRAPASLPSICSHGAQFDKIELTLARRECDQGLIGLSSVDLDYF